MIPPRDRARTDWTLWAYGLVLAPAAFLLALGLWNASADLQMSRTASLEREIQEVRTGAARRAGKLEAVVEAFGDEQQSGSLDWAALRGTAEAQRLWAGIDGKSALSGHRLYAATVDDAGFIVMHTDPQRLGGRLASGWYERRVPEAGPDVVWIEGGPLAGDAPAYDISLPLTAAGRWIGQYHEGLDGRWFEAQAAANHRHAIVRWSWALGLIALAGAGSAGGLLYLGRREQRGRRRTERQMRERARELSQIGGGLAHEVRNPLHALRINLHTLRRAMGGRGALSEEQLACTIQESDAAIDRLDALMRDLLQFTDSAPGQRAELEVGREVQSAVNLLQESLRRDEIEVSTEFSPEPAVVAVDPERLRQMLHNLLSFAHHRAGKLGKISVGVSRDETQASITVTDSGPPLADSQLKHLFEPFQALAASGSGLGMTLVQTFAEASGGHVSLERPGPTGSRLRVCLPLAPSNSMGVAQ